VTALLDLALQEQKHELAVSLSDIAKRQTSTNAPSNIATTALNVVLVIIETLLTLLLRFDADLRKVVYPLATTNTVVRIHAYIPNVTFYVTFTVNGILLDSQLQPSQQVDVTINGFTWQIAQMMNNTKNAIAARFIHLFLLFNSKICASSAVFCRFAALTWLLSVSTCCL
jgi:hypothetical protein